jgi:hypothetical protein
MLISVNNETTHIFDVRAFLLGPAATAAVLLTCGLAAATVSSDATASARGMVSACAATGMKQA